MKHVINLLFSCLISNNNFVEITRKYCLNKQYNQLICPNKSNFIKLEFLTNIENAELTFYSLWNCSFLE